MIGKRNSSLGWENYNSFMDNRPSTPSLHKNLTTFGGDPSFKQFHTISPQNQIDFKFDTKLLRKKSNLSNYCRYQNLTDNGKKAKLSNLKLVNKPLFNCKKSRNNLTLDGMNLSSIDSIKMPNCTSALIKANASPNLIGFHSKFRSETPKKIRQSRETDTFNIISSKETDIPTNQKLKKDGRSLEKNITMSKERSVINDIKESIETSLNHKLRILHKDLKKKKIEYTIRRQQYNDELTKLIERREQESIKVLNYELLNNPRYEYDYEEIQNIKQQWNVTQEEFNKWILIFSEDTAKSVMKTIKMNYDEQMKEVIANAERSVKTIQKIKSSFEEPINEMIKKLSLQEFEHSTDVKKYEIEINDQKQTIEQLNKAITECKDKIKDWKNDKTKNEKRILKELKVVNKENKQMKEVIQEFKDEIDYCKQRENKLMYFLYVMKEKGLPVGEIFESEIKDIPTKRFSKYFDEDSRDEKMKSVFKKFEWLTERIFPTNDEQIVSDTTSYMPITTTPAPLQKKHPMVPNLVLDNLPPRRLHYFSEDSQRSGFDLSFETKKKRDNASLIKKYDLWSFVDRKHRLNYNKSPKHQKLNESIPL